MSAKRILFRVDANPTIGWGHFYRSLALAQMLQSDFSIRFAVAAPNAQQTKTLKNYGFEYIALPTLNYTTPDERADAQFEFDLRGHLTDIDIVVTDGYWFRDKYRKGLRNEGVKIAVIEDDGGGKYDVDLIINHASGLKKSDYTASLKTQFALGPEYALLRPAFLAKAKQDQPLNDRNKAIFICFGGADVHGLAFKIADEVLKNTRFDAKVIASSEHPRIEKINTLKNQYPKRLSFSGGLSAPEIVRIMTESCFGIVPSSGLLYECIACRMPVITGYYAKNQLKIYNGIKNKEISLSIGDFNSNNITTALKSMANNELVNAIRKNQSKLIDGCSDRRIVEIFKNIAHA